MQELILMCGIPNSGKTLAAHEIASQSGAKVFSFEEYKDTVGCEKSYSVEQYAFEAMFRDINKALHNGRNVVVDCLNITRNSRRRILDATKEYNTHKIIHILNTPLSECFKKNEMSFYKDEDTNILKAISEFECPQKFEGFDEIYFYHHRGLANPPLFNKEKYDELMAKTHSFLIYNSEHKSTVLYNHLLGCEAQLKKEDNGGCVSKTLATSALLHDIGKLFCETHDEKNLTHFYSHANFGAYFLMCEMENIPHPKNMSWDSILDIIFYVNYHTKIKMLATKAAQDKYRGIFGEERYNNLLKLKDVDDKNY